MDNGFFDCHTHTEFSSCAEDVTLEKYAEIARTTRQSFAVTDHSAQIFYPEDNRWGFWTDDAIELFEEHRDAGEQRIEQYVRTVSDARCGGMLLGIELDVLPDGRKVFPDALLDTLDIIAGAVHSMPTLRHSRPVDEVHADFRRQVEALAGHGMDVLVHPFRLLAADDVPVTDDLMEWTVAIASDAGFALEINTHKQFRTYDLSMVDGALEAGVTIAIGTDSHRMAQFGDFSYHVEVLQAAGLTPETWDEHLLKPEVARQQAAAE